jgi:hypothetical protein
VFQFWLNDVGLCNLHRCSSLFGLSASQNQISDCNSDSDFHFLVGKIGISGNSEPRKELKGRLSQTWWLTPVILATWKNRDQEDCSLSQPGQKISKTPCQQISWAWQYTSVILAKSKVGRSQSQASPGKSARPYLKNNLKLKGLEVWLKWHTTCLASTRLWVQIPVLTTKKKYLEISLRIHISKTQSG